MSQSRGSSEQRYLLQKRGLYYRPNRCGYTGIKDHAGRYFQSDATLPDVVAIHEDEAPEFSPSCFEDLARQHLQETVTSLRQKLAAQDGLVDALQPLVDLKHQKGAHVIIQKSYSGFQPVTLTITKRQMLNLLAALSAIRENKS